MADEKKFLDQSGVEYLWSRLSLEDYPNNETLIAVLNAIDATKADKTYADSQDAATLESANAYADELNSVINVRVSTLETWHKNFTEVSEEEINALFT